MKKLTLRNAYYLAAMFGTYGYGPCDKLKAGIKALLYKMGLDISLQHPIWFRDPEDCPECMTDKEWANSKYRHLGRLGYSAEENAAKGFPIPKEGCNCEWHHDGH